MKFLATPYHQHLLQDHDRLSAFFEAIKAKSRGVVYDIGAGSGILSYFAAPHSNFIFALEKDVKSAEYAKKNLESFKNVSVIQEDVLEYEFPHKADVIICEMLDTALIDEEQVPAINKAIKYLQKGGDIIPCGVINGAEPVFMNSPQIVYQDVDKPEFPRYDTLGEMVIYNKINFYKKIKEKVDLDLSFPISDSRSLNGIKITTFTLLTPDIICGPTPMLNPPLFIPVDEINVKKGDNVIINLEYTMGGGLNSIKTKIK